MDAFHDYLCKTADYLWRPFLKDPDDDMLLELAVSAGCDAIVTYNKKDFGGTQQFGIRAMTYPSLQRTGKPFSDWIKSLTLRKKSNEQ